MGPQPPATVMTDSLLEMRGISKSFVGNPALIDVDLAVRRGEVHSIVGQNGAGKSTLMNVLAGVLRPEAGEIRIDGRRIAIANTADALRLGIATVYQELSLLANLSVAENIFLGRTPLRGMLIDRRKMEADARAVLEQVGCGDVDPRLPVGALPLARRQFVEIAKALSHEPSVLVLDEPTAPLGREEADRLFRIVAALKARGVAIIFISHRFAEILQHGDRVTILRNGRVVETLDMNGVTEAMLTERMIGGSAESFYAAHHPPEMADAVPAVELRNIGLAGRLRDVSLAIPAGRIVAFTGLLGAGQNELARILGGDVVPDQGEVTRAGTAVEHDPRAAIRAGLCLLTEDRKAEGLFLDLSVRENITLPSLGALLRHGIIDGAAERRAVARSIDQLSIVATPTAPMRTLSGGNQQKAILARWLLRDLAVLVLIEPTRGIDVGAKADIYRDLEALARLGKAIVVISSDVPEVLGIADEIVVFVAGVIHARFVRGQVTEEELNLAIQGKE